ncbi:MAG: transglutaminase-like cysteine peptidase [Gallionellaceae bacterium]|nr:transglutaminase-like cysteine peptidase [Gallionellaceae bacterium]
MLAIAMASAFGAWAVFGGRLDFDAFVQLAGQRYGKAGQQAAASWRGHITANRNDEEIEKVRAVNDFFNRRIAFTEDTTLWGQGDYWATPLEVMGHGAGDCEDFVIAKYFSLLLAGVPPERLRLTYVKARIGGKHSNVSIAHMILGYYPAPDEEPLVLDNLLHDLRLASQRQDLTPVFSFNSEGLWVGNSAGKPASGSSVARLSRWRDLLARMKTEGFE